MSTAGIFRKIRLKPSQLRTVADRRFEDAQTLRKTDENARANGAMYLGGFVVECLLKAKLLEKFEWLQGARSPEKLSADERRLWSLCYRSHDLDEILARLPAVTEKLSSLEHSKRLTLWLKSICAKWTIFARYSPYSARIDEAGRFLDQIKELSRWLK